MGDDEEVLRRLAVVAAAQDAVLTRADVLAGGGSPSLVRRRLRAGAWLPLLRGSYLVEPWRTGPDLQRSWARSAVLSISGAVVSHGSAAVLHGVEGVPRRGGVEVAVARDVGAGRRHLRPHQQVLRPVDVTDSAGIPVTTAVRTLADLLLQLDRPDALAVLDSARRRLALAPGQLLAAAELARGRPGSLSVADLWALADPRAESPLESRARLRCLDAGLPPDELQHEVRDEHGHLLARADMAFRRRTRGRPLPLLLEADGRDVHAAPDALFRDRWRTNALVALGYDTVRCTWRDTVSRAAVPTMVAQAL